MTAGDEASQPRLAVVLVVPSERLRQALDGRIYAFASHRTPAEVEIRVIADTGPSPADPEQVKLLAGLATVGGHPDDLDAINPNVIIGWRPKE